MTNPYPKHTPALAADGPFDNSSKAPRALCQIQMAHDMLVPIVLGDFTLPGLSEEDRLHLQHRLDVLCWVLEHDHNRSFSVTLNNVQAGLMEMGIVLSPLRRTMDLPADATDRDHLDQAILSGGFVTADLMKFAPEKWLAASGLAGLTDWNRRGLRVLYDARVKLREIFGA